MTAPIACQILYATGSSCFLVAALIQLQGMLK